MKPTSSEHRQIPDKQIRRAQAPPEDQSESNWLAPVKPCFVGASAEPIATTKTPTRNHLTTIHSFGTSKQTVVPSFSLLKMVSS